MKPIAILGCGPAGLLAAHACALRELDFRIYSKAGKSPLGGAQYLHSSIPAITDAIPEAKITYRVAGDSETYRKKVYGEEQSQAVPFVSMEKIEDGLTEQAWSLTGAYDRLWELYARGVYSAEVSPGSIEEMSRDHSLIVSSIPLDSICQARRGLIPEYHHFISQAIAIARDYVTLPENTIAYDGTTERSWYRSSNLFGVSGTEWSMAGELPPISGLIKDRKPLHTSCNCFPDVLRVGRRGTWKKGVLTHNAFEDMMMKEVG
jgi:hypothetical protein